MKNDPRQARHVSTARQHATRAASAGILLLALGALANAQPAIVPAAARNLVTAQVDSSQRFMLADRRPAWTTVQNDRGAVPDDLPLQSLTLTLNRSPEREQAFQQLLKDQQDPTSPDYHRWLTPVELGERFGASQHDLDAIGAWLSAQGLHVDAIANSRTRISFSGAAVSVGKAFSAPLHYYGVDGETRVSNAVDPQIPAALATVVQSIAGLHSVKYHPAHRMTQPQRTAPGPVVQPQASNCSGGSCDYFLFPGDFAKIYDLPSTYTGTGQSIAIVSRARVYDGDNSNFMTRAKVTFAAPTVIVPPGGVDPGPPATTCTTTGTTDTCTNPSDAVNDQGEATLDVQRAGSVAPGATLKLIASSDKGQSDGIVIDIEYAIDTNPVPAPILSISFASCENDNGRSSSVAFDQLYQQAAAEGISVFVASGDGGVAGCEALDATPSTTQIASTNTLCASGYVTCVGGTEFGDQANPTAYWSSSNSAGFVSALGYIPEGAWNDPISSDSGKTQFAATGGGFSAYIATPSWQTGIGVPGTQGRYSPDVSFAASTREGYFTCIAAQGASCVSSSGGSFTFLGSGGTSASAPSMAGIAALLNQKVGSTQGNLNPRLYTLAANPANGVFHDVTVGSSGVSNCDVTVPSLCNNSTPGPSGLSGGLQGFLSDRGSISRPVSGRSMSAIFSSEWNNTIPSVFNLDQHGLTGAWYNAATGGQGFLIEAYKDLNGAGKGYSRSAGIRSTSPPPAASAGTRCRARPTVAMRRRPDDLRRDRRQLQRAPKITASGAVGTATLSFADCATGTLNFIFRRRPHGLDPDQPHRSEHHLFASGRQRQCDAELPAVGRTGTTRTRAARAFSSTSIRRST